MQLLKGGSLLRHGLTNHTHKKGKLKEEFMSHTAAGTSEADGSDDEAQIGKQAACTLKPGDVVAIQGLVVAVKHNGWMGLVFTLLTF